MKLATVEIGGRQTYGVVKDGGVADLAPKLPHASLKDAIADWQRVVETCGDVAAETPLSDVTFLPPILDSDKILCIGLNYKSHQEETGLEVPDKPTVFSRFPDAQVGHLQDLKMPSVTHRYDFEGEFAFVIGRACHEVTAKDAMDYVAGYSVFNDGSVRDWQFHASQYLPGKNFLACGSFGPWITTADEIADVSALRLITRLNGDEMQNAQLDEMIFGIPEIIEYVSTFTRLMPGDVVATGTPAGVGALRKPRIWLKPGDELEFEISQIGVLKNRVVA